MVFSQKLVFEGPTLIYVITPVFDMLPVFKKEDLAVEAALQLENASNQHDLSVTAYCIMPSYMHAILASREGLDLSEFIYSYKWLSSRAIMCMELSEFERQLQRRGKFKLWMRRYDYSVMNSLKQFKARLDFIHNSPVKKELVPNAEDWRFSSARDWLRDEHGLIKIEKDISWFGLE